MSSPSLLLQATSVHFRPNRTNLESWAFLGWGCTWAWPSPGRSWPRCCHWGSGCVCWQCQGSSSPSSVNNWCERPGEVSLRFCVCLQSCRPSHHRHHHHHPGLLFPSCSKHRRLDLFVGFFPKWRKWFMTLSRARTQSSCALGFSPAQLGQCPHQAHSEHWEQELQKRKHTREKETLFFCRCVEMNPKYLSFQCGSSLVQQMLDLEGTSVRHWEQEGCCRMEKTVYFSGWKGGERVTDFSYFQK